MKRNLLILVFLALTASGCGAPEASFDGPAALETTATSGTEPGLETPDELFQFGAIAVDIAPDSGATSEGSDSILISATADSCGDDESMAFEVRRIAGVVEVSPIGKTLEQVEQGPLDGGSLDDGVYTHVCDSVVTFAGSVPLEADDAVVRVLFLSEEAEFVIDGQPGQRSLGAGEDTDRIRRHQEN